MEITGREPEIDRIAALAALPRESALLVVGEPGVGKTALLEAVALRVTLPVVRVAVSGREEEWSRSGVSALFAAFDHDGAAELSARFARDEDPRIHGLAAGQEFVASIHSLRLPPTLVLIDDLDRMDAASVELVGFLATRLAGTAIRLVASLRRHRADGAMRSVPVMHLGPLAFDDALTAVRSHATADLADGVAAIIAAETGGNPQAIHEQIHHLRPEQLSGVDPIPMPLRPTPVVEAIALHALSDRTQDDVAVLTRLALAPVMRVPIAGIDRDALDDLADAGLVDLHGQYAWVRDPHLRSYLHWRTSARDRRESHAELVASTDGRAPRQHLWHRSYTSEHVDPIPLLDAARSYALEGLPRVAVAFAERALTAGSLSGSADQDALLALGEALAGQGRIALADRYLQMSQPHRRLPAEARRLRLQYITEYLAGDHVHADELLAPFDVQDSDEAETYVGLLALVAAFRAQEWDLDGARDLLQRTQSLHDVASPATKQLIGATHDLIRSIDGELPPDQALYDGLAASALSALSDLTLILLGCALSTGERYRSARRVFSLLLGRTGSSAPIWAEAVRALSALNEIRAGNFRQAIRIVDQWEATRRDGERVFPSDFALALAWRDHVEGRSEAAIERIDAALGMRPSTQGWSSSARLHALRGRILLLDGNPEAAIPALEAADALARGIRNPALLRHLADLVEALVRAGRPDEARRIAARLAADHHARPTRWGAIALARCMALVAEPPFRTDAIARALDVFEPADSPYERARSSAALAAVDAPDRCERHVAAAAAAFEAAGMRYRPRRRPVAVQEQQHVVAELTPVPATPSDPTPSAILTMLTAEERAVVQKVTQGYRNKEIATSLYMSQRTVELRLTQIYRKVGARSRSHLVALLT
ncbi:LuxR family transcriptional regulator [Curtobacterium ammoniigenes]|uniref:LuxR family transcriptional regulator n=1 Tax=Curtobacterium ammoniigenes TaxID=395387 RepID=UPI00082EF3E0|nr:LuxR family transcriptional regulator [Curtobacterium ammoniigenes]